MDTPSLKPYLIRAIHEWCADNALTPHVAVVVDEYVRVPPEYVRESRIILNIAHDATASLVIGNETLSFKARFGGIARDILVPIANIAAIYARENGVGMNFGIREASAATESDELPETPGPKPGRPHLRVVK
ncbi:MAG: ClpXP protease specificity-enhancing factor [Candidatus Accumulibacter sp.]|jgi:stringent starvation protein B|nr:ClpXP protease specificity-enhancing factor [Accumulibacter sp.]